MSTRLDHTIATMTALAAQQTLSSQIFHHELRISNLQQERSQCQMTTYFPGIPAHVRERSA